MLSVIFPGEPFLLLRRREGRLCRLARYGCRLYCWGRRAALAEGSLL
ncbi:hypothetical protein KTAU_30940 [Thermogemmatispora aurantia]|nr:hypothetical protein KTAU_30940 [Thermogemmatispora aurantia]